MRKVAIAVASLFTALAPAAFAQTYYARAGDTARVIESRPVYEAANSREECWNPRAGHFERLRPGESAPGEPLSSEASLRDALAAMAARRTDRLPVVDSAGTPLGAITIADLVR